MSGHLRHFRHSLAKSDVKLSARRTLKNRPMPSSCTLGWTWKGKNGKCNALEELCGLVPGRTALHFCGRHWGRTLFVHSQHSRYGFDHPLSHWEIQKLVVRNIGSFYGFIRKKKTWLRIASLGKRRPREASSLSSDGPWRTVRIYLEMIYGTHFNMLEWCTGCFAHVGPEELLHCSCLSTWSWTRL